MRILFAIPTFFILFLSLAFGQQKNSNLRLPDTPTGQHVEAYLKAFNSADEEAMRIFFQEHASKSSLNEVPVEQRLSRFHQMKQRLESLELKKVVDASPQSISIVAQAKSGALVQLNFEFESQPPQGLIRIMVEDLGGGERSQTSMPRMSSDAEVVRAATSYLDSLVSNGEFSGVVLLARRGKPLFERAYGLADRDRRVPNRINTKFNIGSINKSFTKIAITQLANAGKLSLKDPIAKFLPQYPNKEAAQKVTIQHLLDMSSGIGDFFGDRYGATPKEKLRTLKDYLPLFADKPLEFEPGSKRRYSNGGYVVLGLIIERASGLDYYDYVRENIYKRAGMLETESYEKDRNIPGLAVGYTREEGKDSKLQSNYATLPGRGSSAGGGYSTVHDLLKFINALKDRKLISTEAQGGLGIAGGAPGLNAAVEWDVSGDSVVIVLCNLDPPSAETVARQIRAWLPR